jgi:hypothetical protein
MGLKSAKPVQKPF